MTARSDRIRDVYTLIIGKIGRFLLKNKKEIQNISEINAHFHKALRGEICKKFPEYVKIFKRFDIKKEINSWKNE